MVLLAALGVAFLVYKFHGLWSGGGFQWTSVVRSLYGVRISLLLLSIAGIYACYALRALRWMHLARHIGKAHFWNVYSATLMGFSCVFLLGRPGEPVRPMLIARKDSLSTAGMFGVYILERMFDIASTAVLAGIALLLFGRVEFDGSKSAAVMSVVRSVGATLLVGLAVVVGFLVYFRYHGAGWLGRRLGESTWRTGWRKQIVLLVEGFSEGLQGIRAWGDLGVLVAYTAVHWFLVTLVCLWVTRAFGGRLAAMNLAQATLLLAITMVGSTAQLPGVGGGSQAASFLVFTLIFGVESGLAATASILLWLVMFAACLAVGVPLLFREGWSMGELRRVARAEKEAGKAALMEEAERDVDSMGRPE